MKKILRWTGGIVLIVSVLAVLVCWGCRLANSIQDTRLFNFHTSSSDFYHAWQQSWFFREEVYTNIPYLAALMGVAGCTLLLAGLEDKK